jgi:hypothetical protein
MSHFFYIYSVPALNYPEIIASLGISDITRVDDTPLSSDGRWPYGAIHLYIDHISTRPLEIEYIDQTISIRIFQASCLEDYMLAIDLVASIALRYERPIHPEGDDPLDVETFRQQYNMQWAKDHCRTMVEMLFSLHEKNGERLSVSGTKALLTIGPRFTHQVKAETHWQQTFFERFRKLNYLETEDIFIASVIHLNNQDHTREASTQVLGEGVATLLSSQADAVTLRSRKGKHVEIAFSDFVELVEGAAIWLSEDHLLVPGLTGQTWKQLFHQAQQRQPADIFEFGRETARSEKLDRITEDLPLLCYVARFSQEDWQKLLCAPIIVFLFVAMADGKITKREHRAFITALKKTKNELLKTAMQHGEMTQEQIFSRLILKPERWMPRLRAALDLVQEKLPFHHAISFKAELFQLANMIAKASTSFWRSRGRIRDAEQQILNQIALIIRG